MSEAEKKTKFSPKKLIDGFRQIEKKKKVRIAVLSFLTIAVIAALAVFLNQKNYVVLFSGMDAAETGEVLTALNELGVDAKSRGEDTVLVPEDRADELRLEMAALGLPSTGLNDYGIYGMASGLGTTSAEKQIYYKYQTEARLRGTILKSNKIKDAVVNLDLGEDSTFVLSDKKRPPTASIMLVLHEGETLAAGEVEAVRELVRATISGLSSENIRIVDSNLRLYAEEDDAYGVSTADSRIELQNTVREEYTRIVENLLAPVFGMENVQVALNVVLNFDERSQESVEYSTPPGTSEGIVVSMKELVEAISNGVEGENPAGLDANGNASQYLETIRGSENAVYYNVSREVNYEVNQTVTMLKDAQGRVERLSVAIIINREDPRAYADEIRRLVASAIGTDVENITVSGMAFEGVEAANREKAEAEEALAAANREKEAADKNMEMIKLYVLAGGAFVVLLLLFLLILSFRPKKEKKKKKGKRKKKGEPDDEQGDGLDILLGEDELAALSPETRAVLAEKIKEPPLELSVEGKDNNLAAVEDFISGNAEAAANLLRNWLNEE